METRRLAGNDEGVGEACAALLRGECVALPTETVYGLFARADLPEAVRAIFTAKQRPANHPLIVHVGNVSQFADWASDIPSVVYRLAKAFCPGALSFVLPMRDGIDRTVTGGQDWVGLRIPSHPLALKVLQATGLGLAGPSANRFGRISPTSADDVLSELAGSIYGVLDGGQCDIGIESTIVKIEPEGLRLLRPGQIDVQQLEFIACCPVLPMNLPPKNDGEALRVSGNLDSHYAPVKPAWRLSYEALRHFSAEIWSEADWVISHRELPSEMGRVQWKKMPTTSLGYAHHLYTALREGDGCSTVQRLWVIEPDEHVEWTGIRDRIYRATREFTSQLIVEESKPR